MDRALSPEQLQRYEEQGMLFPIPVLTAEEASRFRAALGELSARLGGWLKRMDQSHLFFPWAYELATHPRLLDVMEELLGPDLFIHSTRIFAKPPHDPSWVSWHQDGTYSDLNSKPAPSIWIALSHSTVENGGVRVIPGSHRNDKLPHVETYAADNLLAHGERVAIDIDERQAVDMVLKPGEMSIHHVNMIHGSNPNRSDQERIGFAISFITPMVRRSHLPVIRARGRSEDHEFELVAGPAGDQGIDAAIAAHAEFLRRRGVQAVRLG